jgi:hypothetical protein
VGWKEVEGNGRTNAAPGAGAVGSHVFVAVKGLDGRVVVNQADGGARWQSYEATADGRFLALLPRETLDGPVELRVVLNWFEQLERLAPHPRR